MAIVDVLFPPTRSQIDASGGGLGIITFDASLDETHTKNNQVTSRPVEVGANVSDNIRPLPKQLEINGIVSDFPIAFLAGSTAASPVAQGGGVNQDTTPSTETADRAKEAYDELERIMDQGVLVKVITSLRTYENMAISGFSAIRNAQNGNVLNANLTFIEVIRVETETAEAPVRRRPDKGQNKKKKKGKVTKQPPKNESGLRSLINNIFGSS